MFSHRAGGLMPQAKRKLITVGGLRTDRAMRKTTTTGGTYIMQNRFHAFSAIRTLIRTYARIRRFWRKVFITPLTIWSQLKHPARPFYPSRFAKFHKRLKPEGIRDDSVRSKSEKQSPNITYGQLLRAQSSRCCALHECPQS